MSDGKDEAEVTVRVAVHEVEIRTLKERVTKLDGNFRWIMLAVAGPVIVALMDLVVK